MGAGLTEPKTGKGHTEIGNERHSCDNDRMMRHRKLRTAYCQPLGSPQVRVPARKPGRHRLVKEARSPSQTCQRQYIPMKGPDSTPGKGKQHGTQRYALKQLGGVFAPRAHPACLVRGMVTGTAYATGAGKCVFEEGGGGIHGGSPPRGAEVLSRSWHCGECLGRKADC